MTHFTDLSPYSYASGAVPGGKNVGWLSADNAFEEEEPTVADLDLLWQFCRVVVNATRGLHRCEFCGQASRSEGAGNDHFFVHDGETALLGSAEIRVISRSRQLYAAPNLIFHYVRDHRYKPPHEFLIGMRTGPPPSSREYRKELRERGFNWVSTLRRL